MVINDDPLQIPIQLPDLKKWTPSSLSVWGKKANAYFKRERKKRFRLIFEKYGIDPMDKYAWRFLAEKLAIEKYPGLSEARKISGGKPTTWNQHVLALLWCDVRKILKSNEARSAYDACYLLCLQSPWREILHLRNIGNSALHKTKRETLYRRYMEANRLGIVAGLNNVLSMRGATNEQKHQIFEENYQALKNLVRLGP